MLVKIGLLLSLVAGALCAQNPSTRAHGSQDPSPPEVSTVTLCALLSKPADYDGKETRVRAEYNLGFEWEYFADPSCKDYAVKTTPYWIANVVWAEFDKSVDASTGPEIYQRLVKARSLCCLSGWRTSQTELLVTGRFFKAHDSGYGHLSRYAFKLVVSKVEEVGDTRLVDP